MLNHSSHFLPFSALSLCVLAGAAFSQVASGQLPATTVASREGPGNPCNAYPCKPAATVVDPVTQETDLIEVRFSKGLTIRERQGALTDLGTGTLADPAVAAVIARYSVPVTRDQNQPIPAAAQPQGPWQRMHEVEETLLAQMCATAEKNLGRPVADLNLAFLLHLPAGTDAATACDELNSLGIVEMAEPHARPQPDPVAPDYSTLQGYGGENFDNGINAYPAWLLSGGTGSDSAICDIEYGFNAAHEDLPPVQIVRGPLSAAAVDPNNNHGTAVMGVMFSEFDNAGTTGLAVGARALFASHTINNSTNVPAAISAAAANLVAGDVILMETQLTLPGTMRLVPSEWSRSVYDAVVVAVGNGINVVSAAGNGNENLDSAYFNTGNNGHYPFQAANDSGAIMVGAGHSGVIDSPRLKLGFSNYGSRVNVQGWGDNVVTLGYGTQYSAEGMNRWYASGFSGTSSASPIVASAVAIIESVYENMQGGVLSPSTMRAYLVAYGSPQPAANGASFHIGPLPDVLNTLHPLLPHPSNDECAGAIDLTIRGDATLGRTLGATPSFGIDPPCGATAGMPDVWYRVVAPFDGALNVTTCGTDDFPVQDAGVDTVLSIHYGDCYGSIMDCDDNTNVYQCSGDIGQRNDASVTAVLREGDLVYIRVSTNATSRPGPFLLASTFYGAHDTCDNALDVTNRPSLRASMRGMTPTNGLPVCAGQSNPPDAWHRFTACTDGYARFSTCGTNDAYGVDGGLDTVLAVYDDCGLGATLLACNDDADLGGCLNDTGARRDSDIIMQVQAGRSYFLRVSDYNGRADRDYFLSTYFTVGNDSCSDALEVDEGSRTFNTACAIADGYNETYCSGGISYGKDLWFRYVPVVAEPITISTCGSSYDTKIVVYSHCPDGDNSLYRLACNDDFCGTGSSVEVQGEFASPLLIRVGGYGGQSGPGVLNISGGRVHLCPADFNQDGGVDGADVEAFFAAWEQGSNESDVNQDGGIDGADVETFFAAWENGGC